VIAPSQEKSLNYVPVRQLWLKHGEGREIQAVLVFRGYIDESYDRQSPPRVFSLSCLIAFDNMWPWFEMAWVKVLEEKNAELRSQGRKELSRFHAQDINNYAEEFKGWSSTERQAFSEKLTNVFRRNPVHFHGWDMPLPILIEEIPEVKTNPIGFAYCVLLGELMKQIGETTLSLYPNDFITLHHEICCYDSSLLEWFQLMVKNEKFKFSEQFLSIAAERWQHCIPLQPADLIAYENFKEGMRYHVPDSKEAKRGRMRLSLDALINLEGIGARGRGYTREMIQELKQKLNEDPETKQALFKAARISK
jgi:hypothetical protein